MRRFTQVVAIPAGGVWPDVEGGKPLQYFRYVYIENRAAVGSGSDLWVGFGGKRPSATDISTADALVPAGTFLTYNLAGEVEDDGDLEATHQLVIRNIGSTAVVCKVELDQDEIRVGNGPAVGAANSAVLIVGPVEAPGDGISTTPGGASPVLTTSFQEVLTGATFVQVRTPSVFRTVVAAAAGNTVVWTPAAGKRFRLMRYSIELAGNAAMAAAGIEELTLNDNGAAIGQGASFFAPAAAGAVLGGVTTGWRDLGNGYLSAAINQALQINLGTALTAGEVRVNTAGTEE